MAIERIVPHTKEWEAYYANHIFRYQFAANKLKESNNIQLLDAACGVGYGSKYLSAQIPGISITAIDRSLTSLAIAKKSFSDPAINFIEDDCHQLDEAGKFGPFDVIVSFETLEHLPKPLDFLRSCFTNLKTTGKLIVSTPNQLVSSPDNNLNWEFHEKEYKAVELYNLLESAGFINIQLFGQQFNIKGTIKNEVRADLNRLWSNPFIRLGRFLQTILRGRKFDPVLKETEDDFEIARFKNAAEIDELGLKGPFVLIAIAEKN